jgi:hypothetical protein
MKGFLNLGSKQKDSTPEYCVHDDKSSFVIEIDNEVDRIEAIPSVRHENSSSCYPRISVISFASNIGSWTPGDGVSVAVNASEM